ncbi:hypothetical protein I302_106848 [Kwoniella bestiolae CBS 10118]|uniref:Uncharacterized protein n=1 Tax=Kwoniella bestiolae CBS 10118 TaxID=1296100 RepID=A0A1B9G088_9TREE|nr:hypothetical protein I302_05887 [Kwoniella bestiolae CBS 10118]OCF24427.1 hypothetical protein I302_05887 [Kwoniella bestiolae CBS 10118]
MAQTISFQPSHPLNFYCPSSPDPTPLRLLAFSVAEAALQPDPNSPSFGMTMGEMPTPLEMESWPHQPSGKPWERRVSQPQPQAQARKPLWDVVERAKERRVQERSSPASTESTLPQSPPISPSSYNFVLPPNSPLASSVAAGSSPSKRDTMPRTEYFPLYTQSAHPSPVKTTFSGLDQSRPPPEFVPRLSAMEFSAESKKTSSVAAKHGRTKSDIGSGSPSSDSSEITAKENVKARSKLPSVPSRLPSLAQIQARISTDHKRASSAGSVGGSPIRVRTVSRMDSEESIEIIKTPTEESPRREARIVLASILGNRRSSTPPVEPLTSTPVKEPRLAPFLRERTSGRLSGGKARPMSMPPMSLGELPSFEAIAATFNSSSPKNKPSLKVTPPEERSTSFTGMVPSPTKGAFPRIAGTGMVTPTESRFRINSMDSYSTPTKQPSPKRAFSSPSPASPTESIRSSFSNLSGSPSLSVPMITCTPAPQTILKNGVEQDSDEEGEGDVVLFEGDSFDHDIDSASEAGSEVEVESEQEEEMKEREKRAEAMKKRLMLRRRSD